MRNPAVRKLSQPCPMAGADRLTMANGAVVPSWAVAATAEKVAGVTAVTVTVSCARPSSMTSTDPTAMLAIEAGVNTAGPGAMTVASVVLTE